jgi:hypothetical protein
MAFAGPLTIALATILKRPAFCFAFRFPQSFLTVGITTSLEIDLDADLAYHSIGEGPY